MPAGWGDIMKAVDVICGIAVIPVLLVLGVFVGLVILVGGIE